MTKSQNQRTNWFLATDMISETKTVLLELEEGEGMYCVITEGGGCSRFGNQPE